MGSPDGAVTAVENALAREELLSEGGPGVAGLAFSSEDFFCFFGMQKQRMTVI